MGRPKSRLGIRVSSGGLVVALALGVSALAAGVRVFAGAFTSAGEAFGVDLIKHPTGYDGTGGVLTVGICIDPASTVTTTFENSVRNTIFTWNTLQPINGNLLLGANNDIAFDEIDAESTLVHELGHCIGLAHPNAATESGLPAADYDYTKATDGANDAFDLDPGGDVIKGSNDDLRGDDENLHWYRIADNDPFGIATTIDSSTYARDLTSLPVGHSFVANCDRDVAAALGITGGDGTECAMQQGAFSDEDQRRLGYDDVATLRYGMTGVDEVAGTADDYSVRLLYEGITNSCDVVVSVSGSSFAFCSTSFSFVPGSSDHARIASASIFLGDTFNWHFTPTETGVFFDNFESGDTSAWSSTTAPTSGGSSSERLVARLRARGHDDLWIGAQLLARGVRPGDLQWRARTATPPRAPSPRDQRLLDRLAGMLKAAGTSVDAALAGTRR